jgi:opacity protein-like surface antigen
MKKLTTAICALALSAGFATAGDYYSKNPMPSKGVIPIEEPCFAAGEINFDIIGMYIDPTGDGLEDGPGGGIGAGYFFTENFGINTKAYWWDGNSAIHSITASAVARFPIDDLCLAPFIYGGVGGHFDSVNQISGHLGSGVEYRLTDSIGIFADYSYTWADETDNWHGYSLGVRFVF